MKSDPKLRRFARKLVLLSLNENGRVEAERVTAVLSAISDKRPLVRKAILKFYLRMIDREIRATTATVETAGNLSSDAENQLAEHFSAASGRKVLLNLVSSPALIAGTRVRLGDDVYEISIPSRLNGLVRAVS